MRRWAALWLLAALAPLAERRRLEREAAHRRAGAHAVRLGLARSLLERRSLERRRRRLRLEVELRSRAERRQVERLRELKDAVSRWREREFVARAHLRERRSSGANPHAVWHGIGADGSCPAEIPHWEWKLLVQAATSDDARARHDALRELASQSRLSLPELQRLSSRYREVLQNPEFAGILNISHPPCGGRRFAWLSRDRMLRIDCSQRAQYAVDDALDLSNYYGPVKLHEGETVIAFCGSEFNLLSHPLRQPFAVRRAHEAFQPERGRQPSVLVFMVDATSRAHFRRSMPRTLAVLERLGGQRADGGSEGSAQNGDPSVSGGNHGESRDGDGQSGGGGGGDGGEDRKIGVGEGRLHVFDFEHFNIVGYNSLPNQMPFFCDVNPDAVTYADPSKCVWEAFKRRGAVTMIADELHDGCQGVVSISNTLMRNAYMVQQQDLPDHEWWKLFCSPHIKPCCWAQDVPRKWASLNTNLAHEHFMLRLNALDNDLAEMLLRIARGVLQDTVLLMLSDHGTHGIWYNDFEIGETEHLLPFLYMVVPDWILRERPAWHKALMMNQKRMVTMRELYRGMIELAAWPDPPPEPTGQARLSIFQELPKDRTCAEAGIPEAFCACRAGTP